MTTETIDGFQYPAGYAATKDEYAKRMRKILRTGGSPLSDVGRALGVAWSDRFPMPERVAAVAKARALMDMTPTELFLAD